MLIIEVPDKLEPKLRRREILRQQIIYALSKFNQNQTRASDFLGINPRTFRKYLKENFTEEERMELISDRNRHQYQAVETNLSQFYSKSKYYDEGERIPAKVTMSSYVDTQVEKFTGTYTFKSATMEEKREMLDRYLNMFEVDNKSKYMNIYVAN